MEWLFLLVGLVLVQGNPLCPVYTCQSLAEGVCAQYVNMTVTLNSNACPSGSSCSLTSLMPAMTHAYESDFYTLDETEGETTPDSMLTYLCPPSEIDPLADSDLEYNACLERDLEKVVGSGQFPVPCYYPGFEDTACTLVNGEIGQCLCGLNGQAYCALSEGSPLLNSLFEKCGTSMSHQAKRIWKAFSDHLVQYITTPECGQTTVKELTDISTGFESGLLTATSVDLWRDFNVCPVLSCGALPYKTCASVSLNATSVTWTVNEDACPSGYVCELSELMLAVNTHIRSGIWGKIDFPCRERTLDSSSKSFDSEVFFTCAVRNPLQTAAIPNPYHTCSIPGNTDPACQLRDGSFVPCACGLDGQYYCLGANYDSEFDRLYDLCGKTVPEMEIYKWETYGKIKPYLAFDLKCRDTFTDLDLFRETEELPDPPKYTKIESFFMPNASLVQNFDTCPEYTCDTELPSEVCSRVNLTQGFQRPVINLNPNGCPRKQTCSLFDLLKQGEVMQNGEQTRCLGSQSVNFQGNSSFSYPVVEMLESTYEVTGSGKAGVDTVSQQTLAEGIADIMPHTASVDVLFPSKDANVTYEMQCTRLRRAQKTLETGAHPKECVRPGYGDPHCLLKDGSFALCTCGMNGFHYCQVSEGDPEMDSLWEVCEGKNHNLTYAEARFWYFYVGYFTFLQTAPICSDFYEFDYVVQKRSEVLSLHSTDSSLLLVLPLLALTF